MAVSSSGVRIVDSVRVDGGAASLAGGGDSETLVGVTSLAGGAYVVHWVIDTDGDGEPDGLAVQRFAADGTKLGGSNILTGISADLLNSVTDDVSFDLQALDNGGYVLTYGLQGVEELGSQVTLTASAAGQTQSVPLVGVPTEFFVGTVPAGATFLLAGFDSNGVRVTVTLTPVDGLITVTSAILDQFANDNRLTLQVQGLNQGQSVTVYAATRQDVFYDVSAPLETATTQTTANSGGFGVVFAAQGRAETFEVDAAAYANGTGPTSAVLQITTSIYLDLFDVPGAVRFANGVVQIPVTADAGGTYRVPAAILAQLGSGDASILLVLGGLTAGSTLSASVGARDALPIPEGVFVQAFGANGAALSADGVRVDIGAALANDDDVENVVGVTSLDGGAYVVHWVADIDGDGEPDGLAVQRFAADGLKQGGVTLLQGISSDLLQSVSDDVSYDLQALDNGGYVLTYGLQGAEEFGRQINLTASTTGQTLSVPLIGRPTEISIGSAPAGATFLLAGFDNNGVRITVALTPVDGQITVTSAILDRFGNDNRLTLQVGGLNQGESVSIFANTRPEWTYDLTEALANVTTSAVVSSSGVVGISLGQGRPETFHVDSATYANGTGPTFALLQITTNVELNLFGIAGAVRIPNGIVQIPVSLDASGTYRVPESILAQLGEGDAQTVLVLGGLTAGSTLSATIGNRPPVVIPEGVFVQAFDASGIALNENGVRVDVGSAAIAFDADSDRLVGVTSLDGGAYVIHWVTDADGDGEADGLAVQRFAADGTKQGGVTVLTGISPALLSSVSDDISFDLQALENGGYVLTYGLQGGDEFGNQFVLTASATGQTQLVQLIGRPTEFFVGDAPAGAIFLLSGVDSNGARVTVALAPVDGLITITSATLNQFANDNRLTLQVDGLAQGQTVTVYAATRQEVTYDLSAPLETTATQSIASATGVGVVFAAEGRAETFQVDAATYANGTGPTFALLQITASNSYLDLTGLSGAVRLPNGVIQIPVTADAGGTYRIPASILAQLGESDAQAVLILGGLTAGSTLAATVGARDAIPIPEGVFVQTFNANGGAELSLTGTNGSDILVGGRGDDLIDGGAGIDVAVYGINRAEAVVQNTDGTLTVNAGTLGVDRLIGVEQLQFNDGLFSFQFKASGAVLLSDFAVGAGGWSSQELYPRHVADVNGDGFSDIVGFGQAGVLVSFGAANGSFSAPALAVRNFGQDAGWSSDNLFHRELVDVNGDGRADIIGFGAAGALVSLANPDGTFSAPALGIANFGTAQGWATQEGYARATGDVNGDGKADLIGFGTAGTLVSLGNGDGTFQAARFGTADFGVQQGWTSDTAFHRTVADVNGDGKDDIIGFGIAGALVALSKGDGTFETVTFAANDFGRNQGWSSQNSFARYSADVNGDGFADIVGFGIAGTYVAYGKANGTFSAASLDVLNFGANQGWTSDNVYHRELADIDNDGRIDIVGFGQAGVIAGLNQGYWAV